MIFSRSKETKKRLSIITICIAVLFSNYFIYSRSVLAWQPKPVSFVKGSSYSTGILLGGLTHFDKDNKAFFIETSDRFIQTVKLYHQGFIRKVLVSGGSGELLRQDIKEADFLKDELIASGVAEKDIMLENNSRNTFENAVYSKKLLDSLQVKGPYVLITSAIHIPRASKVFKKAGMNIIPFPSDFQVVDTPFSLADLLVPKPTLLTFWGYFIKEIIGLTVYQLTGKA
jgi:uncharacterized SAM-binding protein YcdF (DUF218 family)